ncbi:nuclease-related domain-containing protein [Ornithinibacillus contaminans]|uniref:nuclease-related domain-containing protein n=1 Tax=Ornithinibacillus contaminans TaxID=694055 RepID=UPI00064E1179|nr:nuclease-related domain-containing protein [Ornithinibacillus contaminans]
MYKKYRTKSYTLLCYEALFRCLKPNYRKHKFLIEEHANYLAGYRGEKSADYTLSIYPQKDAFIYQDLRLKNGSFFFQIDTLIVTNKFMLILEIKNLKSEIEYDSTTQQLIQHDGERKKGYKSPILQAQTQKLHLTNWLQQFNLPPIPIETIAVLSNPSTILSYTGDKDISNKLIHLETLHSKLAELYSTFISEKYDQNTLRKLNKLLLREDTPYKPNLLKQFNILPEHLIDGIACPSCNIFPMQYSKRRWNCSQCGSEDKNAHERLILDYFLLHKSVIRNKECRDLLKIDSQKTAHRLLNSMNLKYSGENSGRKYHSPPLAAFPQDSYLPNANKSIFV